MPTFLLPSTLCEVLMLFSVVHTFAITLVVAPPITQQTWQVLAKYPVWFVVTLPESELTFGHTPSDESIRIIEFASSQY